MRYVQQKLAQLVSLQKQALTIESEKKRIAEEIFDDVVDGWDTKDDALNFSLAACNGYYSEEDVNLYRSLIVDAKKYKGEYVCVVRRHLASAYGGLAACIVFDLGILSGDVLFDVDNQYIQIIVDHNSVVFYRDYFDAKQLTVLSENDVAEQSYIMVYPFLNKYDGRDRVNHSTLDFSLNLDVTKQPFTVICGTRNVQRFFRNNLVEYYEDFLYSEGLLIESQLPSSDLKIVSLY